MDIYRAENHLRKLMEYIQDVSDRHPYMYQKSKDRLRRIARECNQVVSLICELLEEESVLVEESEFPSDTVSELASSIVSMENNISRLKQFTSVNQSSKSNKLSRSQKQIIRETYSSVILNSHSDFNTVQSFLELLRKWYSVRFIESKNTHTQFRYNIRYFPSWITSFVILYGKYISLGTASEFHNYIDSWCESLIKDPENNYAIPYEVFRVSKNVDPSDLTLTSVVLWDILMDSGFSSLTKLEYVNLHEDAIYQLCASINPSLLDKYQYYGNYTMILDEVGLRGDRR